MRLTKGSETIKKKRIGKWEQLPLKAKLISCFLLFAFIMLILLWVFQIIFLDDFYRLIKTDQLKRFTHSVAENINDEEIENLVEGIYTHNDMAVAVYNTSADIFTRVYSSQTKQDFGLQIMPHEVYALYASAKESGGSVLVKSDTGFDNVFFDSNRFGEVPQRFDKAEARSLSCAEVTVSEDGTEYMAVIKTQITPVTSTVETLRVQLIIITAVLFVIAVVFAVIVSANISKPLARTNEGAKELSRQNYEVTFEGSGCKEICELNETLNIAAAELSTVDRLRRELIANISHDLRTPLTMISGYAEVMRDIPGENCAENLQVVIDESRRLSGLVTDLLDLSKLEAANVPLAQERFCITQSVRDIFTRYLKLSAQDGYKFDFQYDCDVDVVGDEIRLSQVIYNLINNAVNYCGEDKTVIVRQKLFEGNVRIEVEDHGAGIAEEDLKVIWDRYYRVDKEHKSARIGSGLGLSIAKNVLKLHRARFGVRSQLGVGSTFWFELESPTKRSDKKE